MKMRWDIILELMITNNYHIIGEIGVARGDTLCHIVTNLMAKNHSYLYYGIDPRTCISSSGIIEGFKIFENQIKYPNVSCIIKTSDDALVDFDNDFFDIIFIDGMDTPEQIAKDIDNYSIKLKHGGCLMGAIYNDSLDGAHKGIKPMINEKIGQQNLNLHLERPDRQWKNFLWYTFIDKINGLKYAKTRPN